MKLVPPLNPESYIIKKQVENLPVKHNDNPLDPVRELSEKQYNFAISASKLINKFMAFSESYQGKKTEAQVKFAEAYNNGALPDIFEVIGKRDVKTLLRWRQNYLNANRDYRVLAPNYKTKRPSSVTPQESEILITNYCKPSKLPVSEVVRQSMNFFEAKRFPHIKSSNTYRRFLLDWKTEHYADYVFYRYGEQGLDNKVLPYLPRDWNRVEVGDILIMDGHVNNYEIINPFPNKNGVITGKPKRMMTVAAIDGRSQYLLGYEIQPTENVQSIAVAIYRAVLNLGKKPKVIYFDNGKAFGAKYFHGDEFENLIPLFKRLETQVIFAKAYHGQSKPIEPFWGWMAELERLMPTYVGTSIQLQPPRMNRGEKLHMKLYEKAMQNTTIDIWTAHKAMQWWLSEYHTRAKTDGHLKGLTPAEVFLEGRGPGISRQELNYLMMETKITKLYRNGIRMFSEWYWNEELFGKQIGRGDEIVVKYDIMSRESVLVFDRHGEFICEAKKIEKVHPAARLLGTPEELEEVENQLQRKEHLKSTIVKEAKEFLNTEIYPAVQRQLQEANIIQIEGGDPEENEQTPKAEKTKKRKRNIVDRWREREANG